MDYAKIIQSIFWPFFKLFLALIAFAIVLGLIAGIFTYGRPLKKRRNSSWLEDIMDDSMAISHALIDFVLNKFKGDGEKTWLNDQELIAMLRGMHPSEFEEYIANLFSALGYQTRIVGGSGDGGIDIEMSKDGRNHLVQCKKFITRKVNPHDVRDFFGAMGDRHINGKGFFVTTNIFTLEAERFAEEKPIELIDGSQLIRLIRDSGLMDTQKRSAGTLATQPTGSCPNCGAPLVLRTNKTNGNQFFGCSRYPACKFTKSA